MNCCFRPDCPDVHCEGRQQAIDRLSLHRPYIEDLMTDEPSTLWVAVGLFVAVVLIAVVGFVVSLYLPNA